MFNKLIPTKRQQKHLQQSIGQRLSKAVWLRKVVLVAGIVTLVGAVLIGGGIAARTLRYWRTPIAEFPEFSGYTYPSRWDGETQLVVGFWLRHQNETALRNGILIIDPPTKKVAFYLLPEAESVRNPLVLSSKLFLPIDRYVVIKSPLREEEHLYDAVESAISQISEQARKFVSWGMLHDLTELTTQAAYTNLSPWELRIINNTLAQTGTEAIHFARWPQDSFELEAARTKHFVDPLILKQSPRVWIRNATTIPGLANQIGGYLQNLGYDIVRVDNVQCQILDFVRCDGTKTFIVTTDDHLYTWPVERMNDIVNGEIMTGWGDDLKRAEVIVIVGEDFGEKL